MMQEQKNAYLHELGIRLRYAGFQTSILENGRLSVEKSGTQLCEINDTGNIHFHPETLTRAEEELVRGTVKEESEIMLEYMKLMAQAPEMNTGNEIDHYKLLVCFNCIR